MLYEPAFEGEWLPILKRHSIPIWAIFATSDSVSPSPSGGAAMSIAYSPMRELRKGRMSSVCSEGEAAGKESQLSQAQVDAVGSLTQIAMG